MKLPKELLNGIIITIGIGALFLVLEILGYSKIYYLRILNVLIVYYGVHRTIKSNMSEGKSSYVDNLISAGLTAFIGIFLSIISLVTFIYIKGGDSYLDSLSEGFLFGGKPSINEYCIGLLFEGIASAVIVVFIAMQLWRSKTQLDS